VSGASVKRSIIEGVSGVWELLEKAESILNQEPLCHRCLGCCFAKRGSGLTNEERGRALRMVLAMKNRSLWAQPESCTVCRSIFTQIDQWVERALERIQGYEFRTYLMGTRMPRTVEAAERTFWQKHAVDPDHSEPIKQEFNRETGKRFGQAMAQRGQPIAVDFREPEVVFLMDLERDELRVQVNSLFLYGRYRKLIRGIPQTKWPCRACKGRGCEKCAFTGKTYPESVEELIAGPILQAALAREHAFHGAGREDVDARMLGTGRPFVLEIYSPRKRSMDVASVQQEINQLAQGKVEVSELRFVKRRAVEEIKERDAQKTYHMKVVFAREVNDRELREALKKLIGEIEQRTPQRVRHRRADLVRSRRVLAIQGKRVGEREALVEVTCDGGLYVKELISGDEGRTRPSLAELLNTQAQVVELDVLSVQGGY
jgi:tRNA pseudouridine synthase 10